MINYNDDYQYNSCSSHGICSPNPRTSSLQEILILYLRLTAYYALKLENSGKTNDRVKNLILNTISMIVSNPEFSENNFQEIAACFNKELPAIIKEYENLCNEKGQNPDYIEIPVNYDKNTDIISSIRLGEKEFLKKVQGIPSDIRDLYRILFVLAKSICINILDLESYGLEEGYEIILKLLNSLNFDNQSADDLKNLVIEATQADNKLMKHLYAKKTERYGIQRPKEVSYSTTPAKAILVVGSNIRELEIILESIKEHDIDVYTHDEMILAHTFPYFETYPHLKGQYGQGMENCLLDFATFPGPIILTRHSLYNVENLYRGRLYTTDNAYYKGIIQIHNNDFSEVIDAAETSKGFKTGKTCDSEIVGFDREKAMSEIESKIEKNEYTKIFILGLNGYTKDEKEYFETLLQLVPDEVLVISLSNCIKKSNVVCLNACFDSYAMLRISEDILEKYSFKTTLFFPKCDRHTISKMIYLSAKNNADIFVGKCTPITLNPNLINTLTNVFGIKGLTTPKNDLKSIFDRK